MKKYLYFSALLGLTIFAFWHCVSSGYVVWDDNVFIQENPILRMPFGAGIRAAFGHFYFNDYLPLPLMSYWAEVSSNGFDPIIQHLDNLLIHLANVTLLAVVLQELFDDFPLTLFVCTIFAIHPLQVESVLWISERKGLLCVLFSLLAIWSNERSKKEHRRLYYAGYSLFFTCALLCKMTVVLLPLWLVGLEISRNEKMRKAVSRHAVPLGIAAVMLFIRIKAYTSMSGGEIQSGVLDLHRLAQMPLSTVNALGFYIKKVFWPQDLSIVYPRYEFATDVPANLVFLVMFLSVAGKAARESKSIRQTLVLLGLFIFPLIPVLPFLPWNNYVADRYLYLPIIGVAAVTFTSLRALLPPVNVHFLRAGWALLCGGLVYLTISQSAIWRSNESLWRDTIRKNPANALARLNLGIEMDNQGRAQEAIDAYSEAAVLGGIDQVSALALNNIGLIYATPKFADLYDMETAREFFERAYQLPVTNDIDHFWIQYYLAKADYAVGKKDDASFLIQDLATRLPSYSDERLDRLRELVKAFGSK